MKLFELFLILILSFSLQSAFGEESLITIDTDKENYLLGDIIHVSGYVDEIRFGSEVNLMLVSPNGDIALLKNLIVDGGKKFSTDIVVNTSILKSSGDYTILASYGPENGSDKITLSFLQSKNPHGFAEPQKNILLNFDFVKPTKKEIQEHVDYKITVSQKDVDVYGTTSITHSSTGSVSLPIMIGEMQSYEVLIEVHGILFQQSSVETASFKIMSGSKTIQSELTSKDTLKINLAINRDPSPEPKVVPDWVKNNAKWWAMGLIEDETFVNSVSYLIQNKIVDIPDLPYPASWMDKNVPSWVKNNASWWADDLVQEDDFIKGLKFLVEKGVIQINPV